MNQCVNKFTDLFRYHRASASQQSALRRFTYRHLTRSLIAPLIGMLLASAVPIAFAQSQFEEEFDDPNKPWEEISIQLPAAPQAADLLPFYVAPTATQTFALDAKSLSVGTDGVVRYTLVASSSSGAKSVSYEGIRCASFEQKIYAFGRDDGSWSRSRRDQWEPIVRSKVNRQHAALAMDYFCSNLLIVGNAQEMLFRIKTGKTLSNDLLRE